MPTRSKLRGRIPLNTALIGNLDHCALPEGRTRQTGFPCRAQFRTRQGKGHIRQMDAGSWATTPEGETTREEQKRGAPTHHQGGRRGTTDNTDPANTHPQGVLDRRTQNEPSQMPNLPEGKRRQGKEQSWAPCGTRPHRAVAIVRYNRTAHGWTWLVSTRRSPQGGKQMPRRHHPEEWSSPVTRLYPATPRGYRLQHRMDDQSQETCDQPEQCPTRPPQRPEGVW